MRLVTSVGLLLALAVVTSVTARATSSAGRRTVPCDQIILRAASGTDSGYRVVLGVISVPPAYLEQVVRTGSRRWPYWRKAGLVVRGGTHTPVDVSVPSGWRNRAAITWGYPQIGTVSALRIAPCPSSGTKKWNVYSGGFSLRSPSACVLLVFRVGQRGATVRFGVGRRC